MALVKRLSAIDMKIALLGDIHGNIAALNAAYGAAMKENPDKVYHLGDLGGYAPFVNEVVDFLMERGIEGVQGNYDEAVANDKEHCGCRYEDPLQAEMSQMSFEWTKKHVSRKSKDYMMSLPFDISFSSNGFMGRIFHATPFKNNLYWYEERDDRFFLDMAHRAGADVMVYGHTHIPYRKDIGGRIFINVGSVGRPKDGDARPCLTVVEILSSGVISSRIRVPYDVDKTAQSILESGLPAYFAERLKKAE